MTKTVIIADDHPIFRRGLCEVFNETDRYRVIGEAGDGVEALSLIRSSNPDIAILDISMPEMDGLDVLIKTRHWAEPPIVVVLTLYDDEAYLRKALENGALGYILKDNAESELIDCLDMVVQGKHYLSPAVSWMLVQPMKAANDPVHKLTVAEHRILTLVSEYKSNAQIADLLSISIRTVQNHRANIRKKLGLSGPNSLLRFASKNS